MNLVRGYPRAAFIGLLTIGLISTGITALPAQADELTVSQDTYRDGWDQSETTLDPASVTSPDFGRQFATTVDGQVYAQPLVVGSTLIAATENDKVYGLDKATGAILWTDNFGPSWPANTVGCADLVPNLGITSTPVYDPASGYVFLVAKANDGADAMHPHYYMHAVNPTTGTEKPGFPVMIGGHPSNDASATFDPAYQGQRPGLLLLGGVVYAGFGSHCDFGNDFRGYIAGVSTAGVRLPRCGRTRPAAPRRAAGSGAAAAGWSPTDPDSIIVASGNGTPARPRPPARATSRRPTSSESVIRLHVNADGSLGPADFFSPTNNVTMDQNDTDLGSGGPMALPDGLGTAAHPNLMVQMARTAAVPARPQQPRRHGTGRRRRERSLGAPSARTTGPWGHAAF